MLYANKMNILHSFYSYVKDTKFYIFSDTLICACRAKFSIKLIQIMEKYKVKLIFFLEWFENNELKRMKLHPHTDCSKAYRNVKYELLMVKYL